MREPPLLPAFTGLLAHHDPVLGYALLVPDDWHRLELAGSGGGVFYAPTPDDLLTGLAIEARDLGVRVRPTDLPTVRAGFLSGLRRLSACRVEQHESEAVGELLTLEARHTFRDGGAVRKRWVRVLYKGRVEVRLIAQGATEAAFTFWEPMFFEAMRTVHFGAPLW